MSLRHGDLSGTVSEVITLDEFAPKSGNDDEVVVVGFYTTDQEPANDLNTFIQRGVIDVIDTEVSPNPDHLGRYLVFVELRRDKTFPETLRALLVDVENLSGSLKWVASIANDGTNVEMTDEILHGVWSPAVSGSMDAIIEYLGESHLMGVVYSGRNLIVEDASMSAHGTVVDFGDNDVVMQRNGLEDTPLDVMFTPSEVSKFQKMLGAGYFVTKLGDYVAVSKNDSQSTILLSGMFVR